MAVSYGSRFGLDLPEGWGATPPVRDHQNSSSHGGDWRLKKIGAFTLTPCGGAFFSFR